MGAASWLVYAVWLVGGPDVAPRNDGAEPHPTSEPGQDGFATTELGLARACLRDGKPLDIDVVVAKRPRPDTQ